MVKSIKVGIFVTFGLALVGVAIFMIGDNKRMWDPKIPYRASFADVAGLKPGAPVRMGGVDIGTVTAVGHADEVKDARIHVTMAIVRSESNRVYNDSVAKVANKGLLGDKMIEITVTDGTAGKLDPTKAEMKSEEPVDFGKYLAKADSIAASAEAAIGNIERATRTLGDPKFTEEIKGTVSSLHDILDAVAHKDSTVHRLLTSREEADRIDRVIANVETATRSLDQTLSDVRAISTQVKTGPGIAHAVLYDGQLSANAAGAVAELEKDLRAIREGNGIARAVIYGDDKTQQIMGNVNAMSGDLRSIVAGVKAGKGTIGGLLVDPSIYEDLKSAIGNVERNEVLRALVRYSIKADESKPKVLSSPK
ncbi:MAG: MlaD family protein [Polyangiaceae bacterium]